MATLQLDNELAKSLGIVVREPLEKADHRILMHTFFAVLHLFASQFSFNFYARHSFHSFSLSQFEVYKFYNFI